MCIWVDLIDWHTLPRLPLFVTLCLDFFVCNKEIRIQNTVYEVKTSWPARDEEIQDSVFCCKGAAIPILGTQRPILEACQCFAGQQTEGNNSHVETVNQLDFEELKQPICSPDFAPSDYHIYGPLKDGLPGHRLPTNEDMKKAVDK